MVLAIAEVTESHGLLCALGKLRSWRVCACIILVAVNPFSLLV